MNKADVLARTGPSQYASARDAFFYYWFGPNRDNCDTGRWDIQGEKVVDAVSLMCKNYMESMTCALGCNCP